MSGGGGGGGVTSFSSVTLKLFINVMKWSPRVSECECVCVRVYVGVSSPYFKKQ